MHLVVLFLLALFLCSCTSVIVTGDENDIEVGYESADELGNMSRNK